jgi:hypothetical protein
MRLSRRHLIGLAALGLLAPVVGAQNATNTKTRKAAARRPSAGRKPAVRGAQQKKPASQPAAPPRPKWPDESIQTVAQAVVRLREIPAKDLGNADLARRAALEFALAVGNADGGKAAEWVDAVGYQALPREGPLPEQPDRAVLPEGVRTVVQARQATDVGAALLTTFEVIDQPAVRTALPDIGRWMLPADLLVWIAPDARIAHWVTRREFVVVRIRGRKATVAGGSLLTE